jgi:hypothetical protein
VLNSLTYPFSQGAGGYLEQAVPPGTHTSIETTEKNLGWKQRFQNAVNDAIAVFFHLGLLAASSS